MSQIFGEEDNTSAVEDDPTAGVASDDSQADGETPDAGDAAIDGAAEVIVSIGDQSEADQQHEEQARAPDWVRDLRKANREKDRRIRELEARISQPAASQPETLGAKPTLSGVDYDEEKFSAALDAWHDRKRAIDARAAQAEQQQTAAQQAWQVKLDAYSKAKSALKVRDFEDAEGVVQDALSATQQGILINGGKASAAALVYALGSSPKLLNRLAGIKDPIEFTWEVAQMAKDMKITPKKSAPPPERVVRGSSGIVAGGTDATLERLQAQADKTGDRTQVAAYLRNKKASGR